VLQGLSLLALLASLGLTSWAVYAYARSNEPASAARGASRMSAFMIGHADIEGGVTQLYPLQPNRVVAVKVKEYDRVKKDAVLLQLDDRLAQAQLAKAKAALKAAEAQRDLAKELPVQHAEQIKGQEAVVEARQADLKAAEAMRKRADERLKSGTMTQDEVDAAQKLLESARAALRGEQAKLLGYKLLKPELQIARTEDEVEAAKAEVKRAQQGVEECKLTAPADGVVVRVLASEGETLGPNPRQPALYLMPDGKPTIVRAEVEQEFASDVHEGDVVEIYDDTRSARAYWTGKIATVSNWYTHRRSILQEPLQMNDVRTLECIVKDVASIKDAGERPLRIGQRVRVKVKQ
jgi:multidrug resistance efflux pump